MMGRISNNNKERGKEVEATTECHLSQKLVRFFVHPQPTAFSCSIGTFQGSPMPPSCVEPNRESLRTNLALLLSRAVRVEFARSLVPLCVVVASEAFLAVAAKVLLLGPILLLLDTSGFGATCLLFSNLYRDVRDLLVGDRGS